MKHAIFLTLFFVFTCSVCLVWSQSVTDTENGGGSNCSPTNCQALCNPGCSANTTCVLGTMKLCGVCPSSLCIDNSLLGLPVTSGDGSGNNDDDGTTAVENIGDNHKMLGGMIGGLVGGGLLLMATGLVFMHWHKKQNSKKIFSPHVPPLSQKGFTNSAVNTSKAGPTSPSLNLPTLIVPSSGVTQQLGTRQVSLHRKQPTPSRNQQANDDSYNDMDDDDGRSSISSVSHHGLASMITVGGHPQEQGFPGTRLKPQIMRLSTVRASMVNESLNQNRSSSVRTMLTPHTMPLSGSEKSFTTSNNINNNSSTVSPLFPTIAPTISAPSLETETTSNPFDDRHCVIDR
ncbi:hypothetical protein BCR42DRAFT_419219 [Absidia repens]|uniref:Membrane anchor Opy2 N-terminal domain-containing protein n=1 Tax=Absidia repens TaxID=90262 RepID=A0A1X2IB96_9FUNG|nr:hypothetical protein BCR42DRAFT_419219 [Absidia repens]